MFVYPKINYGAVMSRGKIFSSLVPGLISQRIKSLSWIQLWYSDTNIDYTLDNPRHGRISSLCNAQQGNSLSKETWLTSSQTKLNHSSIQERPWGLTYRPKNVVKSRLSFDNSLCPVFKLAGYQRTAKDCKGQCQYNAKVTPVTPVIAPTQNVPPDVSTHCNFE